MSLTTIVCVRECVRNGGESARQAYLDYSVFPLQNSSRGSDGVYVFRPNAASEVLIWRLGGGVTQTPIFQNDHIVAGSHQLYRADNM